MKIDNSVELYSRAFEITGTKREDLDLLWPVIFEKGDGPYVIDVDGNRFLDFTAASGAITLGYSFRPVTNLVDDYLKENGNVFITKMSRPRIQLAEKLKELVPGTEYVSFHKTGSDATSVAVRYAKLFTSKDIVLSAGYHGWHDWQLNMFDNYKIPDTLHLNFEYDLDMLEKMCLQYKGRVACIIVTPEPHFFPKKYFIELQEIARKNNILFILDEVASGFRYELGGYQKYAGLTPDMSVFGKGLANEYAIAAVVGRKDVMTEAALKAHTWGTFDAEVGPIVASLATLEFIQKNDALNSIAKVGRYFSDALKSLFDEFGLNYTITPHPSIFHIIFDDDRMYDAWIMGGFERGVILSRHDYQLISYTHTKDHIDQAVHALRASLVDCKMKWPQNFGVKRTGINAETMTRRIRYEFGGTLKYRENVSPYPFI